ncbi:MAG: hypothetical protein PF450_09500 [Bacteroidales bacterium]|jgi:hypothetical protein|nr:hypothetical protein [Bacteroidales bacterium]
MYENLPFRPDSFMAEPWLYEGAPINTNGIRASPEITPAIPAIATIIANTVSSKAQMNAGRMFAFNQLSNNKWNNNEYIEVIGMGIILTELKLQNRVNPSDALRAGADEALEYWTAMNFKKYPSLRDLVDPNTLRFLDQAINEFTALAGRMAGNQQRQQPQQVNYQQGQVPIYNGNQNHNLNSPVNNQIPRFGNVGHQNQTPSAISSGRDYGKEEAPVDREKHKALFDPESLSRVVKNMSEE